MKTVILALSLFLVACSQAVSFSEKSENSHTLIIYYDKVVGDKPLLVALEKQQAEIVYRLNNVAAVVAKLPEESDFGVAQTIEQLSKIEGVLSVQRDSIMQLH